MPQQPNSPPRADAGAVVAVGRRQVDDCAQPAGRPIPASNCRSASPRAPRRGSEIDGVHYHFLSMREFERLRDSDALLEWAEVHGNCYGRRASRPKRRWREGRDMLFDIDWQGAEQLSEKMRADIVSIFILPPSMTELKSRLKRRAEDSEAMIERRLQNARIEIEHWREYDYVVINDDLDRAFAEVKSIVTAERLRRDRRPGLFDFVSGLLDEKTSASPACRSDKHSAPALTNSSTLSVSARRVPSIPTLSSSASPPSDFRLWRSILRR